MKIIIDANVPLPGGHEVDYPFQTIEVQGMVVGDSFYLKNDNISQHELYNRICFISNKTRYRLARRYFVDMVNGGIRCWRIE